MSKVAKIITIACLIALTSGCVIAQTLQRFVKSEPHLGTLVSLTGYSQDQSRFDEVAELFFQELERLNQILSDYDDRSEVSRINGDRRKKTIQASKELCVLLSRSIQLASITGGVMDPTLGRLTHLWKKAFARDRMPTRRKIRRALRHSGHHLITIDTLSQRLNFEDPCLQIDLGAMGKGYIGDLLSAMLTASGLPRHLIDLGGDLVAAAPPPNTDAWQIALADGSYEHLAHGAIATSGTTYQFLEHRGKRYSHLIDVRTGYGLTDPVVSTVIARNGLTADAMASALPFLTSEERTTLAQMMAFTFKILR